MRKTFLFYTLFVFLISCNQKTNIKSEIEDENSKAESEFNSLSETKGIAEAFYTFADSFAVFKRENDALIRGKENIKKYYNNPKYKNVTVQWKPDFTEVSQDGNMAYTYIKYVWVVKASAGNTKGFKGIFYTIWKRQKDESWKYV